MRQELHDINSRDELRSVLAARDISVPRRTEGRKSHHTETYSAFRLIATLNERGWLSFPFSAISIATICERPDYYFRSGERKIGLEITEAIATEKAWFDAVWQEEYPGAVVSLGPDDLNPESTRRDFRRIIERSPSEGSGWGGDQPEQDWAASALKSCRKKEEDLTRWSGESDERWLLICMNEWLPAVDIETAAEYCRGKIEKYLDPISRFARIYVEDDRSLVCFDPAGHVVMPTANLWRR